MAFSISSGRQSQDPALRRSSAESRASSSGSLSGSARSRDTPRSLYLADEYQAEIHRHIAENVGSTNTSDDEVSAAPSSRPLRSVKPYRRVATISTLPSLSHSHAHGNLGLLRAPKKCKTTHERTVSTGSMGLKRLQKVLPSLSIPSFSLPIFTSPFDFGMKKSDDSPSPRASTNLRNKRRSMPPLSTSGGIFSPNESSASAHGPLSTNEPPASATPSPASVELSSLERTATDDSLLFTPLERMSSLGDDTRWADITEQVNIRGRALRESLPEIKIPRLSAFRNSIESGTESPISPNPSSTGLSSLSFTASPSDSALDRVLESLEGDVVILGGYRGSILRSAEPPHQQLWAPVKLGLGMRTPDLAVGLNPEDEETMEERIIPSGMLQHVGPVDVSRRLYRKLKGSEAGRSGKLRVWDYGYDWRLSPHLLSRKLVSFLENLPSNKGHVPAEKRGAIVIAHSLGGLITRHAVNMRPELFSGVIYAGTPQRCVNILGPLRFGDPVLFNHDILTSRVNFTFRTSFVFLPEDGKCFVNKDTGEEYPVNFYDVDDWIKYRLCPEVSGPPFPRPAETRTADGITAKMKKHGSLVAKRTRAFTFSPSATGPSPATDVNEEREQQASAFQRMTTLPSLPGIKRGSAPAEPLDDATLATNRAYLARTLAEIRLFRSELGFREAHAAANAYPPMGVIFAKNTATLAGARIPGPEAMARADAYDLFLFQSGDGVVLARQAMLPEGYSVVSGGLVEVQRGHLTLLGDLEGVGKALEAVVRGRRRGIGIQGRKLGRAVKTM
ncbi:hypothetical protein TD95_000383 [Thielaviopsis punctulata]|uniref:Uncharacterized protein n=1 Tax=Thielaviopsis punctulata TaxID=72032 RepID=A0A0F4ZAJ2_9PEZI|nr:hypothetical protein TD95_000383 [Thielaviopsis punctulata]